MHKNLELPTTVLCRYCRQPMQEAEVVRNGGKAIARRYVCGCQSPPFQHNLHAGNQTQDK